MLYLFNNDEELIKIIPKQNIIVAEQTQELNKMISLDVELKGIKEDELKESIYIGHYHKDIFYLYKILRCRTNLNTVIKAVHIVFDELKSNGYIRDKRPSNTTAPLALSTVLEGTRWRVGTVTTNKLGSANWYDKTKLEALTDIINNWGVELRYRLIFNGFKITNRYIDVLERLGDNTGTRIVYGTNAVEVVAETNKSSIYTAIIGRGKGEEKTDEEGEATGGFGRRIDFKEAEWSKNEGYPLEKPLGEEMLTDPVATEKFGFKDPRGAKPRIKIEVFGDCTDPSELLELSYKKLMKINRPLTTLKAKISKVGNLNLGDTVNIVRRDLDLYYSTRVFKLKVNLLEEKLTECLIGDYIPSNRELERQESKHTIDNIDSKIDGVQEEIGSKINNLLTDLKEGIELSYWNDNAFNYELSNGNKWELPAGYYSFNAPIDSDPSKVIFFGAGKLMIANKKKNDGSWDWSTFGTGDGFTADLITAGTINGNFIEAGSIKGDRIEVRSLSGELFKAGSITANEIKTRGLTAEEIEVGTLTAKEIKRKTIEGNNVEDKTLDSDHIRELKLDILRPGDSNRIVFEGDNAGANNAMSIDATDGNIRLKKDSSNYVRVNRNNIEFYTSSGKTWTKNGTFYGENFDNISDVRAKENIKFVDSKSRRIKRNDNVEVLDLNTEDIIEFFKDIKVATYNYQFQDKMQVGAIAQNLEKADKVGKYLVTEDKEEKRKYVNLNNLQGIQLIAIKELINKIDVLENKIKESEEK